MYIVKFSKELDGSLLQKSAGRDTFHFIISHSSEAFRYFSTFFCYSSVLGIIDFLLNSISSYVFTTFNSTSVIIVIYFLISV